jgi:hypothetical protein
VAGTLNVALWSPFSSTTAHALNYALLQLSIFNMGNAQSELKEQDALAFTSVISPIIGTQCSTPLAVSVYPAKDAAGDFVDPAAADIPGGLVAAGDFLFTGPAKGAEVGSVFAAAAGRSFEIAKRNDNVAYDPEYGRHAYIMAGMRTSLN